MKILDLTPGPRAIWFDKQNSLVDFCYALSVKGGGYSLVVFDPPHVNVGGASNMSKSYGHSTTAQIREFIVEAAKEAHRVTVEDAIMAFKWNTHDQSLLRVLALMAEWWEPLFGHKVAWRTLHSSSTYWVQLRRI